MLNPTLEGQYGDLPLRTAELLISTLLAESDDLSAWSFAIQPDHEVGVLSMWSRGETVKVHWIECKFQGFASEVAEHLRQRGIRIDALTSFTGSAIFAFKK